MTPRGAWLLVALALGGVLLIYGPHVVRASFVYEDTKLVDAYDRPAQSWTRGRGLSDESWTMIRTPRAAHALNLILHLLVAVLTGALLWHMTTNGFVALATAAIVAVHPVGMEGVAYASSRGELLAAVGALLALVCLTARAAWPWALVPLGLGLAYGGKETGLVVLGLLPLVWWMQGETRMATRVWWGLTGGTVAFLLAGGIHYIHAYAVIGEYVRTSPVQWALLQSAAVYRLLVLSVAPFWLSVSPDLSRVGLMTGLGAAVLLAGLLETAWRLRPHAPLVTGGILWCALIAAPRFLIRTPTSPFNEHQWYLALPGVACVWVGGLLACANWLTRRQWADAQPWA